MKKSSKVLLIVGLSFVAALAVSIFICLSVIPTQTKQFLNNAWVWLNEPLPVVGMSTLMVCILAWRLFASSSFGKKQILEFKREAAATKEDFKKLKCEYEEKIKGYEELIHQYKSELDKYSAFYTEILKEICKKTPNAKVKKIGDKLYVKEKTTNNEAKAD